MFTATMLASIALVLTFFDGASVRSFVATFRGDV